MWQFNQSNYKLQLKHCKLYTWCCKFSGMLKWNVLLPSGCWHIEKQGGVRQVHIWNPFLRTRSQEEKTTTARHIVPVAMITSCSWTHLRAHDTSSKKEVTDSSTVPWNRQQICDLLPDTLTGIWYSSFQFANNILTLKPWTADLFI